MLDILTKLDAKGVRSAPISPFAGPAMGITTSLSDGIMPRNGRNNNVVYFHGDFVNGPLFSDLPFDPGCMYTEAGYRAVLKRELLQGPSVSSVWQQAGDAATMFRDELTMMIMPRWHVNGVTAGEYNYLFTTASSSPSVYRWERTLTYRSLDAAQGTAAVTPVWDMWIPIHSSDRPMPVRTIPFGGTTMYYIDPGLSKTWHISAYNPAYPILVNNMLQSNWGSYGIMVVTLTNGSAGVTGTPSVAHRYARTAVWQGTPHVFNSARASRLIIDSTGISAPVFVTGVSNG